MAQEGRAPWRAGAVVGAFAGGLAGLEVQRTFGTGILSSRVEALGMLRFAEGAEVAFAPPGTFDDRGIRSLESLAWVFELGPRSHSGERSVYLLAGAGVTALQWDDGRRWERGGYVAVPRNATETVLAWSGGLGLRTRGRIGVELRLDRAHTKVENLDGARFGVSLGF